MMSEGEEFVSETKTDENNDSPDKQDKEDENYSLEDEWFPIITNEEWQWVLGEQKIDLDLAVISVDFEEMLDELASNQDSDSIGSLDVSSIEFPSDMSEDSLTVHIHKKLN